MFFSKYKNDIVDKSNALVGRDDPLIDKLSNEINGRDLMNVPKGFCQIVFGMGCFWGAERIFWNLEGLTGHTEVVKVVYDPNKISLKKVLVSFWEGHDPTQGMRQGNDIGTQYRSAIFITNKEDLIEVKNTMKEFQGLLTREGLENITTEIKSNVEYYFAEIYHQQYLYKNPNGYCGLGGCGIKFN